MKNKKVENIIKMVKEIKNERYIQIIYEHVLYYYTKQSKTPPNKD